jgi:hypothetical protein
MLLHPDAEPHSCAGYVEHAVRLSGADGQQPGLLKLAHALANNVCVACGAVTRFVAWNADGADGPRRCCSGCSLPAGSGESGVKTEVSLLNELFFSRHPVKVIDATTLTQNAARMQLQIAVYEAQEGDTIALCGSFSYDDSLHGGGFGTFAAAMGKAIRLIGLPRPAHMTPPPRLLFARQAAHSRENLMAAEAALGEAPFTRIHVRNNCIELYAPGAMLENLELCSGHVSRDARPGYAAVYAINSSTDGDINGASSLILKRCWLNALLGSSLVLAKEARCAAFQSVFTETPCYQVHANRDTVLRISGCHLLDARTGPMLSLTGQQKESAVRAVKASNVIAPGTELLFRARLHDTPSLSSTRLLA